MTVQEKTKIYPKLSTDDNGIKYFFDHNNTHYTIRFAGKPMIILEYLYIQKWWEDFVNEYENAKNGILWEHTTLLRQCIKETQNFIDMLQLINNNKLSPFVIYINTFNQFK